MNGLKRYNAIQKALSSYKKESWVTFIAGFQKTASQIYRQTKRDPLKRVIENIDKIYKNFIPELPSEIFEEHAFFDYDIHAPSGNGIVDTHSFPKGLHIKCPQLKGKDWIGSSDDADYEIVFKDFSNYINENRDVFWKDSNDAPRFQFGKIDFDDIEGIYFVELTIDRDDTYGFEPDMEPEKRMDVPESVKKEPLEKEEIEEKPERPEKKKKEKKEKKEIKEKEDKEIKKIQVQTEKIKAETEKAKASKARLTELNKAVKNLDSMYKRKIITKKEYNKYYKKLMGF